MRKLLFDKLINKNLWKIIAPQWMKAPPLTATKISQFRLVYGIMDKMDVTAQPKTPVSHTNTTIQIHTYKRLASSIAKSFALSVDEFALFQFNSIQFAALLFLSICVYFTFDKWWMPKRPSNRRPPLPQAQAHSLAQNARTCIFQPIQNWFYWVTQFVLTIFIEIRKLCAICHPKFVPWQTFLVWHTAQHSTAHGFGSVSNWCAHSIPQFYMQTKAKWKAKTNIRNFVRWSREYVISFSEHGQPYGNSRERAHRPYHK